MAERALPREAWAPLCALTLMNTLNYVDRYVVTALLPNIAAELHIGDGVGGLLGTAFMVVYFLVSPLFGALGDRGRRPRWLALGVGLWSLATAAGAAARNVASLFAARAVVGVGESAYGTIAPSLLADHAPPASRGRLMAIFYLATPVGAALGYLTGGLLGAHLGWRPAFLVVGLPGLCLALWALCLADPPRGRFDPPSPPAPASLAAVYLSLWRNRLYRLTVAGYTAYTFALGGMAFWMPTYLIRERHQLQAAGMLVFGGITVVAGALGTLAGGALGDALLRRTPRAYAWVNTLSSLAAAGAGAAMLAAPTYPLFLVALAAAQVFAFMSVAPVNAILLGAVPASVRATAMAACIFFIHLLGDAASPALMGLVSDRHGLQRAFMMVPAVFLLAAAVWGWALATSDPRPPGPAASAAPPAPAP